MLHFVSRERDGEKVALGRLCMGLQERTRPRDRGPCESRVLADPPWVPPPDPPAPARFKVTPAALPTALLVSTAGPVLSSAFSSSALCRRLPLSLLRLQPLSFFLQLLQFYTLLPPPGHTPPSLKYVLWWIERQQWNKEVMPDRWVSWGTESRSV